jgi:hypothetical protein
MLTTSRRAEVFRVAFMLDEPVAARNGTPSADVTPSAQLQDVGAAGAPDQSLYLPVKTCPSDARQRGRVEMDAEIAEPLDVFR